MTRTRVIIGEPDVEGVNRIELVDYNDGRAEVRLDVGSDEDGYTRETYRCVVEGNEISVMTKEVDDEWEAVSIDDIPEGVGSEIESVRYTLGGE